jgi:hypothetical protein
MLLIVFTNCVYALLVITIYIILMLLTLFIEGPCRNPSLGFTTEARGCKVAGQEKDPGVTSHAPGSAKSVRE